MCSSFFLLIFFILFGSNFANAQVATSTTTTKVDSTLDDSVRNSKWMIGTDIRSFGVSDVDENFAGLKIYYRADNYFLPYIFASRYSRNDDDGIRREWISSGVGFNYSLGRNFISAPFIRIQTQNVESNQNPYRSKLAISSYGAGYSLIVGKLNLMASMVLNATGHINANKQEAPPFEYMPMVGVFALEMGFHF